MDRSMRRLVHNSWFLLAAVGVCLGCPNTAASGIPSGAATATRKLAAAAKAADYTAIKQLLEPTIVTEAGADPVSADVAIAQWKAGTPALSTLVKTVQSGCQLIDKTAQVVVCPRAKALENADLDAGVYTIGLRPNARGVWLLFTATYAD
jgi:hypothetical protein